MFLKTVYTKCIKPYYYSFNKIINSTSLLKDFLQDSMCFVVKWVKWNRNLPQNLHRIFSNIAQFLFTVSETELQSFTKYLRQIPVLFENVHYKKSEIAVFQEIFTSMTKFLFWEEDWALGNNVMKFWYFHGFS